MKTYKPVVGLLCLASAIFATAGCLNLTKSYPEKRSFVLDVAPEARESVQDTTQILKIGRFRVSPMFAGRPMVYRVGNLQYDYDFYNEWFIAPGSLLTEQFYSWLSKSGRFRVVVTAADHVEPTHLLEAHVTEFYGDYRKGVPSAAVFSIELRLLDLAKEGQVLVQRSYHKEVPLSDRTPDALVAGLSHAAREILVEFDRETAEAVSDHEGRVR